MNGAEVFLQVGDQQAVSGRISVANPTFEALVIELDEPLVINNCFYVNFVPLLKTDGVYRDLLNNCVVLVKWAGICQ